MIKYIISGPESSGKTTLCKELSKFYNTTYIKEYAREHLLKYNNKYQKDDLYKIAKKQYQSEQKTNHILICDTDLITIKIWSLEKYKSCDDWILKKINAQKTENRIYLLCSPDIKWHFDPQRENPNDRNRLLKIFKSEITSLQHPLHIISGKNRCKDAIKLINKINLSYGKSF